MGPPFFSRTILLLAVILVARRKAQAIVDDTIREILASTQSWQHEHNHRQAALSPKLSRPFVSLSFAQSLDGKIARYSADNDDLTDVRKSSNYPLSGSESLRLTHALRSIHDAILIGRETLEIDNPRLTSRLWGNDDSDTRHQPRPIVLDTHLSFIQRKEKISSCRLVQPIVCCSVEAASSIQAVPENVTLLPCQCAADGRLDLRDVLFRLWSNHGVRTVMVEGGVAILSSFLEQDLFDSLCITISPQLLGLRGLYPVFQRDEPFYFSLAAGARFATLGDDAIFLSQRPT
jgi:riboflavin-specific deaminase-like protein